MSKNTEILKKLRGNKSVAEFSKKLGCNRTYYYHLENGIRDLSINILKKLKKLYPELDMNIFFEE